MYTLVKRLMSVIFIPIILSSCIRDHHDDCGMYLEFIFNYNMEYADSFNPQVGSVDVYIFDEEGKYLFHKHAKAADLFNHKCMHLNDNFETGTYQLITVGGMSDHFRFTDRDTNGLIAGVTTIEQVRVSLYRTSNHISHEFPHLWFGETTTLHYKSNASVCPVYLVRNTNRFNIMLQSLDESDPSGQSPATAPYHFEIITPEGAVYGYDNAPLVKETVTYHPYYLQPGNVPESLSAGKLNTMRLFYTDPVGYRLVVRKAGTSGEEVWNYDLMDLLEKTKPLTVNNGQTISMQEYLDRQGEWNIIILHRGGKPDSEEGMIVLGVDVNDWIIWFNDIEI